MRLLKTALLFLASVVCLAATGVNADGEKFTVIAALFFWSYVFYFLHPYMNFIGMFHSLGSGSSKNDASHVAWKFLASLIFIIALVCWASWD